MNDDIRSIAFQQASNLDQWFVTITYETSSG